MSGVSSSVGLPIVSLPMPSLLIKNWRRVAVLLCSLLVCAAEITAAGRTRSATPIKFTIKVVDSSTGKPKTKFFLGETISVVFTVTNHGRRPQTIANLHDTYVSYTLVSTFENEDPEKFEDAFGGTARAYSTSDSVYWTESEPRKMTLAPGQSASVTVKDLRRMYSNRLSHGHHTLTATMGRRTARVSFAIVIDESKTIPLLEQMAENGDERDKHWANDYLKEIREPSLSGIVTDTAGKPLKDVEISVTGPEDLSYETRANGRYYLGQLTRGGTYTLTPSLERDGNFDADYSFEPASRTITNLNSHVKGLNFTATRVRPSTNVADRIFEGAKARASSTLTAPADEFEPDNVIDGTRSGPWDQCCNAAWVDATPNTYPDWVEIKLRAPTAIDWINVFTVRDNPDVSDEPPPNEVFTKNGITDFDVQYWNGRVWKNVPGGAIRGNRNVWRKIAFAPITTDKIRVVVRKALGPYSKIMEIEAFHINQKPVAKLSGRSTGRTGSSFQFHTNASDKDRAIYKYTLSFGDGTPNYELEYGDKPAIKELNITHTHTYAAAGTYTVTLTVMDHDNEGTEWSMTVTVTDPPIPPFFKTGGGFHGVVGEPVVFEGRKPSDPAGKNALYYWDFGDGASAWGSTTSHKYAAPGTYGVIVLIVENDGYRMRYAAPVVIVARAP